MKEVQENKASQIEVFLNSVPILTSLSREEKLKLAAALEEQSFEPQQNVVEEVCIPTAFISERSLQIAHCFSSPYGKSSWGNV